MAAQSGRVRAATPSPYAAPHTPAASSEAAPPACPTRSCRSGGARSAVDPVAVPGGQVKQRPDVKTVVAPAAAMLRAEAADIGTIEPAAIQEAAAEQFALDPPAKIPAQPLRHRRTEAHLAPVDNFIRDQSRDGPLQQMLGVATADLVGHGNVHGELDQFVIEEWHPRLDRGRHADLVDAHEEQLRQAQLKLVVDHPREHIAPRMRRIEGSEK